MAQAITMKQRWQFLMARPSARTKERASARLLYELHAVAERISAFESIQPRDESWFRVVARATTYPQPPCRLMAWAIILSDVEPERQNRFLPAEFCSVACSDATRPGYRRPWSPRCKPL